MLKKKKKKSDVLSFASAFRLLDPTVYSNALFVPPAASDSVSGSLIAVYNVCSNEREEWNQEEQSMKNRRGTKGRSERDHSGV